LVEEGKIPWKLSIANDHEHSFFMFSEPLDCFGPPRPHTAFLTAVPPIRVERPKFLKGHELMTISHVVLTKNLNFRARNKNSLSIIPCSVFRPDSNPSSPVDLTQNFLGEFDVGFLSDPEQKMNEHEMGKFDEWIEGVQSVIRLAISRSPDPH
jgi:hypothetical protein